MPKTTFKTPAKTKAEEKGLPKPTFSGRKTEPAPPEKEAPKKATFGAKTPKPTAPPKVKFGAKPAARPAPEDGRPTDEGAEQEAPKGGTQYSAPTDRQLSTRVHQDISGEVDNDDQVMPSLKLVQSIGPMSESFEQGIFVLNGETPISNAGPVDEGGSTLRLSVIRCMKKYQENVEWGSEEPVRTFNTLEEVRAVGGHTDWINNEKPPFSSIAMALVAIECPSEDVIEQFPFEFEGKNFSLAAWTMKGTAYTRAAKMIFTAAEFSLKEKPLAEGAWDLSSKRVNINGNLVWAPILKRVGSWSDAEVAFFRSCV